MNTATRALADKIRQYGPGPVGQVLAEHTRLRLLAVRARADRHQAAGDRAAAVRGRIVVSLFPAGSLTTGYVVLTYVLAVGWVVLVVCSWVLVLATTLSLGYAPVLAAVLATVVAVGFSILGSLAYLIAGAHGLPRNLASQPFARAGVAAAVLATFTAAVSGFFFFAPARSQAQHRTAVDAAQIAVVDQSGPTGDPQQLALAHLELRDALNEQHRAEQLDEAGAVLFPVLEAATSIFAIHSVELLIVAGCDRSRTLHRSGKQRADGKSARINQRFRLRLADAALTAGIDPRGPADEHLGATSAAVANPASTPPVSAPATDLFDGASEPCDETAPSPGLFDDVPTGDQEPPAGPPAAGPDADLSAGPRPTPQSINDYSLF